MFKRVSPWVRHHFSFLLFTVVHFSPHLHSGVHSCGRASVGWLWLGDGRWSSARERGTVSWPWGVGEAMGDLNALSSSPHDFSRISALTSWGTRHHFPSLLAVLQCNCGCFSAFLSTRLGVSFLGTVKAVMCLLSICFLALRMLGLSFCSSCPYRFLPLNKFFYCCS